MNRILVTGVLFLFIASSVIPSTGTTIEKSSTLSFNGKTLYVGGSGPGNYSKIQDAIDDASDGDTVFVFSNSSPYYEQVWVHKSINLIGEDRNCTVIDGSGIDTVVYVYADGVKIIGFTIQNSRNSYLEAGIAVRTNNNTIYGNDISENYEGIQLVKCLNNIISGNNISNNEVGIASWGSDHNIISRNDISNNEHWGMEFFNSSKNIVRENNIRNNRVGFILGEAYPPSDDNKIYHNNFINKWRNAWDDCINIWDDGYPSGGNFWDDYYGPDGNDDGIGDTPYRISCGHYGVGMKDMYPLMLPYNITEAFLTIKIHRFGLGVKISIKNVGIEPAYDVNWNINIVGYGSGFLNLTKKGSSSLPLQIGDEKKLRFLPFGRGVIDISITANASNAVESKKSAEGLIFLCFVIVYYL